MQASMSQAEVLPSCALSQILTLSSALHKAPFSGVDRYGSGGWVDNLEFVEVALEILTLQFLAIHTLLILVRCLTKISGAERTVTQSVLEQGAEIVNVTPMLVIVFIALFMRVEELELQPSKAWYDQMHRVMRIAAVSRICLNMIPFIQLLNNFCAIEESVTEDDNVYLPQAKKDFSLQALFRIEQEDQEEFIYLPVTCCGTFVSMFRVCMTSAQSISLGFLIYTTLMLGRGIPSATVTCMLALAILVFFLEWCLQMMSFISYVMESETVRVASTGPSHIFELVPTRASLVFLGTLSQMSLPPILSILFLLLFMEEMDGASPLPWASSAIYICTFGAILQALLYLSGCLAMAYVDGFHRNKCTLSTMEIAYWFLVVCVWFVVGALIVESMEEKGASVGASTYVCARVLICNFLIFELLCLVCLSMIERHLLSLYAEAFVTRTIEVLTTAKSGLMISLVVCLLALAAKDNTPKGMTMSHVGMLYVYFAMTGCLIIVLVVCLSGFIMPPFDDLRALDEDSVEATPTSTWRASISLRNMRNLVQERTDPWMHMMSWWTGEAPLSAFCIMFAILLGFMCVYAGIAGMADAIAFNSDEVKTM